MDLEILKKLGKRAFIQSLRPYNGQINQSVAIFGLDTEYIPYEGKASDLICWQLASKDQISLVTNKKLTIKNLFQEAKRQIRQEHYKIYVFVCFFSLAEIQFFNLNEWLVSEFKGKYRLTQSYGDGQLQIVDLANWYPKQKLEVVAKLWGYEKLDYPIVEKVEAIARGELTKVELLHDPEFRKYAKKDAVLNQKIYTELRGYFIDKFEVDIVSAMTPAGTSASMFRKGIMKTIDQRDTVLRSMALGCCWGGRMEAIYRGEIDDVYEYDATGHHPSSAMALYKLPRGTDWKRTNNLRSWLSGISGVGKVYFKFPDDELYPCLPIYHQDALLYPLEGVSFCTVSEVLKAKEQGASLILYTGYYYNDGVNILAKYLEKLQTVRNHSTDSAERQLLKLLSNSIIGKFFQKSIGVDLVKVQKYAEEKQIPVEEAMRVEGVDFGDGEVKVGSCFYPEWYALILGKARATISTQVRKHNALIISSDSFVTTEYLGETFTEEDITYNLKAKGILISYRTRFYRVGDKLAHHAVHSLKASEEVLSSFKEEGRFKYGYFRITHLREAWRDKKVFGSRVFKPMTVELGFDYKRRLLEDGTTKPWKDLGERDEFLESLKKGGN